MLQEAFKWCKTASMIRPLLGGLGEAAHRACPPPDLPKAALDRIRRASFPPIIFGACVEGQEIVQIPLQACDGLRRPLVPLVFPGTEALAAWRAWAA
jgi:hypothetical protein